MTRGWWWVTSGGAGDPEKPRPRSRSVYEQRGTERPEPLVVDAWTGRPLNPRPCCDNLAACDRPECWSTIIDGRQWTARS